MASRIVVLALVMSALLAPGAVADSIVYERDGNIWQAEADGTRQTPITSGGGYSKPSQADDGTIVAVKDKLLHRLDRSGHVLNTAGESGGTGPLTPQVSPQGNLVAYNYFSNNVFSTTLSHATRNTAHEEIFFISGWSNPSWIGNGQVLMFDGSQTFTGDTLIHKVGESGTQTWFEDAELSLSGGEINAAMTSLAATDGTRIRLYRLNAPPPAIAVEARCDLTGPTGSFFRPTWSPDGVSLAWQEDDGIWAGAIELDSGTCQGGQLAPDHPGGQVA